MYFSVQVFPTTSVQLLQLPMSMFQPQHVVFPAPCIAPPSPPPKKNVYCFRLHKANCESLITLTRSFLITGSFLFLVERTPPRSHLAAAMASAFAENVSVTRLALTLNTFTALFLGPNETENCNKMNSLQ